MGDEGGREGVLAAIGRWPLETGLNEALPETLEEAHQLIRELRDQLRPLEAEAYGMVAQALFLTLQQAALVLVLARARRAITAGQLEARLPSVLLGDGRSVNAARVHVHDIRQRLGAWAIMHVQPYGYTLDPELAAKVRALVP